MSAQPCRKEISSDYRYNIFSKIWQGSDGEGIPYRGVSDYGKPNGSEQMTEKQAGGGKENQDRDIFGFPYQSAKQCYE